MLGGDTGGDTVLLDELRFYFQISCWERSEADSPLYCFCTVAVIGAQFLCRPELGRKSQILLEVLSVSGGGLEDHLVCDVLQGRERPFTFHLLPLQTKSSGPGGCCGAGRGAVLEAQDTRTW